jgi:hypothetical protein
VVLRGAVVAEVARDEGRRRVVVVQHEPLHHVAARLGELANEAVDGPVADLRVLPLGEPCELLERPDRIGHRHLTFGAEPPRRLTF